jgi:CBS domain containing-hemolysin-like protein
MNDPSGSRPPRENGADDDSFLMQAFRGLFRGLRRTRSGDSIREALEELIEERDDNEEPIDSHERLLIGNILKLREQTARDVMLPRADIVAVEAGMPFKDLIQMVCRQGHSRMPVYRGTLDDALGMVHIKDVMAAVNAERAPPLTKLVRKVLFVSPSIRVMDLLLEMRLKRTHMALVVDEYGGIDGLVTIEDLVEQIVGEIEDEHDLTQEPEMVVRPDGVIEADARTAIEDFEARLGPVLTEEEREDVDTLGGLVFYLAGRVPSRGELISHPSSGIEFEVVDADPRRIKRLRVRPLSQPSLRETA